MKILQKIIIISILFFTITSCTSDDENLFEYVGKETSKITGVLTTEQSIVPQDGTITVNYTLPQSFTTDAIMQIKASMGVAQDNYFDVTILAGESTGEFTIDLNENVNFAGQKYKVSVSGLKQVIFEDVENDDGDIVNVPFVIENDNLVMDSNTLEFLLLPDYEEGKANFIFGWDDGSDFDIILKDAAGTNIADSQTGSNPETFMLDDTLADGDYTLFIVYYAIVDDNSIVYFNYRNSQGVTSLFESELSGYVESTSDQIAAFTINKAGVDYTITKL